MKTAVRMWLHLASYKEDKKRTRPKVRLVINFCCNFPTLFVFYPVPSLHFARLCITAALLTPKVTLIFLIIIIITIYSQMTVIDGLCSLEGFTDN